MHYCRIAHGHKNDHYKTNCTKATKETLLPLIRETFFKHTLSNNTISNDLLESRVAVFPLLFRDYLDSNVRYEEVLSRRLLFMRYTPYLGGNMPALFTLSTNVSGGSIILRLGDAIGRVGGRPPIAGASVAHSGSPDTPGILREHWGNTIFYCRANRIEIFLGTLS